MILPVVLCACDDDSAPSGAAGSSSTNPFSNEFTQQGCLFSAVCDPAAANASAPDGATWFPTPVGQRRWAGVDEVSGAPGNPWLTVGANIINTVEAVWVSNTLEGTVSKLNAATNEELARYPSVDDAPPTGAYPWDQTCVDGVSGNCPAATAVDQLRHAYVANRAFNGQGTVTKYAAGLGDCVDRNNNGVIDTSKDDDGDGTIDINNPSEFVGTADECILWTVAVGQQGPSLGVPRALAVGASGGAGAGDVWVGVFYDQEACALDPASGAVNVCVSTNVSDVNRFRPFAAVTSQEGRIWMVDRSETDKAGDRRRLGYVNPVTLGFQTTNPVPSGTGCGDNDLAFYGIALDTDDHIFLAGAPDCGPGLYRFTLTGTTTGFWDTYSLPGSGTPRGLALDGSSLWMTVSHTTGFGALDDRLVQFNATNPNVSTTHNIPTGQQPIGVAVSSSGDVWAACATGDVAARFTPSTGTWNERTIGSGPYGFGDSSGYSLNVLVNPNGFYRYVVEGCTAGISQWESVEFEADTPPGTSLAFRLRTANGVADLSSAPWVGPFSGASPIDLRAPPGPVPEGLFAELEIILQATDVATLPRVRDVVTNYRCNTSFD